MKNQEEFLHDLLNLMTKSKFELEKMKQNLLLTDEEVEQFTTLCSNFDHIISLAKDQRKF